MHSRSGAPSHRAMTTVATPLPTRFVSARASDRNRSTPSWSARPATGNARNADRVAASVTKPAPERSRYAQVSAHDPAAGIEKASQVVKIVQPRAGPREQEFAFRGRTQPALAPLEQPAMEPRLQLRESLGHGGSRDVEYARGRGERRRARQRHEESKVGRGELAVAVHAVPVTPVLRAAGRSAASRAGF